MVFRRDNKVDSFQRQMNALRNQLGTPEESGDALADIPDMDEDQYSPPDYRSQPAALDQDSGAYSFGSYPAESGQPQAGTGYVDEQPPEVPALPATDASVSVVARDTSWKGEIDAENTVQIFGRFEGSITAREDVWIVEGAEVDATITAQRVIVGGTVAGTVNASSRFEALPGGQVSADVTAPISVVHEGARINGNFRIGGNGTAEARAGSTPVVQRRGRSGS